MSILAVPDMGLQLESSSNSSKFLPMQAFGITLNDGVIEDMIRCVQNGQKIELALGNSPTLRYSGHEEHIEPSNASFDYDLYLTNPSESATKAQRLPYPAMSILRKPGYKPPKPDIRTTKAPVKGSKQAARASSPGSDSDTGQPSSSSARGKIEKRTHGYESSDEGEVTGLTSHRTKPTSGIQSGKGAKSKHLLPPGKSVMAAALSNSATRSLPSSPALNGVASPSHNPIHNATQGLLQKNKGQRTIIVHELAVQDQPYEYLKSRWDGSDSELKTQLGKVADLVGDKWSMKKMYWKELDVWTYDYDSQNNRQKAIDNAIKQYDRQRLGTTAPEWERLLKKEDRGKGIVLSKLQATLAKGNITPAPKMSKADDGSKNDSDSSKGKGGEAMARSNSQPVGSKVKSKVSEREAQAKRLLSSNPKKAAPAPKKAAVSKVKAADSKQNKRVLSEETIQDSSSDEEDAPPTKVKQTIEKSVEKLLEKPAEKAVEKVAEKAAEKRKELPATAASKPKVKQVVRAPKVIAPKALVSASSTAQKRPRDDDDSSSSSGTPLSKRLKPKEPVRPLANATKTVKHRPSDASVNSRGTATSTNFSAKSKNTSPAKSSPLASSPPTNASDLDDTSQSQSQSQNQNQNQILSQSQSRPHTNGLTNGTAKKRKERDQDQVPVNKKSRVSREILEKARKFEVYYKKYADLHHDLTASDNPSQESLDDLLEMHNRLVQLKTEIMREVSVTA